MGHKKFFVKDFIQYASPCFGCDKPLSLRLLFREKNSGLTSSLTPVVTGKHLEVDLSIQYTSQLRLWILHKSNTFLVNDNVAFSHYIAKRDLWLVAECGCGTKYETNNLDFQTFNGVIGAVTLRYECIVVGERGTKYTLNSLFSDGKTTAVIAKSTVTSFLTRDIEFNLPLLPKYKLRDRQHLIDKLKIYTLFS